ncbi:CIC11C00000001999 [Sungouiella intermedia]|uniref:Chromatin modification-related protein n=1 Tax=Sungouiella intermedia TaxID=45354 RepID=A0A1L0DPE4_9ASCO|nr:CIC11C00000001999 [[Candida] intermedia]
MHTLPPARQKSQRLVNRLKADQPNQYFMQYRQKATTVTSPNELLPGLNDILDAFEAMPMDLVKYFTLLKEIDAKCINTVPVINRNIASYIEDLHHPDNKPSKLDKIARLSKIRKHIHEVIPCLEEKMHVTSVAADVLSKHLYRINNDYKLITSNNEIPELIRIGTLNHRAIVMDPSATTDSSKLAQLQRSESRREALAARKSNKDTDEEDAGKKRKPRETTPLEGMPGGLGNRKRRRDDERALVPPPGDKKRLATKPKKEREDEPGLVRVDRPSGLGEPTYCYCNQVSFGEMVGCDGDSCKREWFHLPCIGFKNPPKGKWYCDDCLVKMKKAKRV